MALLRPRRQLPTLLGASCMPQCLPIQTSLAGLAMRAEQPSALKKLSVEELMNIEVTLAAHTRSRHIEFSAPQARGENRPQRLWQGVMAFLKPTAARHSGFPPLASYPPNYSALSTECVACGWTVNGTAVMTNNSISKHMRVAHPRHFGLLLFSVLMSWQTYAQGSGALPGDLKKLSVEELLNVEIEVTSVARRPQRLGETASAIQVITAEDIRRSGANSLPEVLRLATNLEVAQVTANQWAVSARGLSTQTSNQLLVLLDGRSVYTPRVGGVFWDVQDTLLEDIEQIEVISGPGAALWGANAVNGVVNITTRNARATQGLLAAIGTGNEWPQLASLRYGGSLGAGSAVHYRVYAKHRQRDDPVASNGVEVPGGWHMNQGGFRADAATSGRDAITVQGDLYHAEFDSITGGASGVGAGADARGYNLLARWRRALSNGDLRLQLFHDHTRRRARSIVAEQLDTYDIDFQHYFSKGNHQLVWGAGYRHYDSHIYDFSSQLYVPAQRSLGVLSGFIQDEIELARTWRLTLGTKLEHNDYTDYELQPSVRLAWLIDPNQMLWGAVSRAIRTPARNDREQYLPATPPHTRIPNPNFVAEEMLAYEMGYRLQPGSVMSLSLSSFYNEYDKLRSRERVDPATPALTYIGNGQYGESYGAELMLDYYATQRWRLQFSATEIRIRIRPRADSTDTSFGAGESFDPKHQYAVRSSLDLPRGIQLDARYRYVSEIVNSNVPAYGELDLRLAWQALPNLELSIVGQNLLHDHHAEFGNLNTRREIERGIYGKLLWSF